MRVRQRPRRLLYTLVSLLIALVFYFFVYDGQHASKLRDLTSSTRSRILGSWPQTDDFTYVRSRPPKITVIAVWTIRSPTPPIYFPYFFRSVEANPQVDLLFVQIDKLGYGCSQHSSAPNVQDICLSEDQYYDLHVDFLCKRWKCTEEDRNILFDRVMRKGADDINNTFFRILRNGIFRRWIDPATTIWGWCDVDTVWGNFERAFPWDIAHDFDIVGISSQPEFADQRLLFTRGHMAFFRHSPDVLDRFHAYPKFSSLSAYLTLPGTLIDAEESEFSHFMFTDEESFTFIFVEGMVDSYDTVLLSAHGVFYVPLKKADMTPNNRRRLLPLIRPKGKRPVSPTFSMKGVEKKTRVFADGKYFQGGLWFDKQHATFVETGWNQTEREQKAYFMRRNPYGPITQRIEPRERFLNRDRELGVDECLYKHWQAEKHRTWFRRIPEEGLESGQIMVTYHNDEAEIWNENGEVIYETGSS